MRGASASFGTAAGGSNFYVLIPDGYDEAASEFTWAELVGDNILVVDSDQGVHTREGSLVILPANDGRTPPLVIRAPINVP